MKKLKLCALIAAAGQSSRMGAPKALIPIGGEPALVKLARVFNQALIQQINITLPRYLLAHDGLKNLLTTMPVKNMPNFYDAHGYAGSIKTVIEKLSPSCDGILITPVDSPFVSSSLIRSIINLVEFIYLQDIIKVPKYYMSAGHPVYLSKKYFPKLKNCFELGGLNAFIAQNYQQVKILYWPDKLIGANLNSRQDLSLTQAAQSCAGNFGKAHDEFCTAAFGGVAFDIATKAIHGHFTISQPHASTKFGT